MLPDLSNDEKMARIGRLSVLRSARRDAAKRLRDTLIPILNKIEGNEANAWEVDGITDLVNEINELTAKINELS